MEGQECFTCCRQGLKDEDFQLYDHHQRVLDAMLEDFERRLCQKIPRICVDCVYDRLYTCEECSKRAPLCMFHPDKWYRSTKICVDCCAILDAGRHLQSSLNLYDYGLNELIHQCLECGRFLCALSFPHREGLCNGNYAHTCLGCIFQKDVEKYKREVRAKYERKLKEEPSLSVNNSSPSEISTDTKPKTDSLGKSYASVVSSGSQETTGTEGIGSDGDKIEGSCEINAQDFLPEITPGPFSITTVIKESICDKVLQGLEKSLSGLEQKTKLELQLLQLSEKRHWQLVLKDKLLKTEQKFSNQATSPFTSFADPESRWAYLGLYTAGHATIIQAVMKSGCFKPLTDLIKRSHHVKKFHVCCIGAGPGTDVLGLQNVLPKHTEWLLFDNCEAWFHSSQVLLGDICGLSYRYGTFDITCKLDCHKKMLNLSPSYAFRKASLFTFVKFVSAVQHHRSSVTYFKDIFQRAQSGSQFLFIDNAHPQTKTYIEDLVFPDSCYTDHGTHKESKHFQLYTSYAELQSDFEETLKSQTVFNFVMFVHSWLDRKPLMDLRVHVFLVIKKSRQ